MSIVDVRIEVPLLGIFNKQVICSVPDTVLDNLTGVNSWLTSAIFMEIVEDSLPKKYQYEDWYITRYIARPKDE